jgi:DNA-directed RNA polymerase specialized sigma24 family protein
VEEEEQETFFKAWRGLPAFCGDAALRTWLTRLAARSSTWLAVNAGGYKYSL